MAKIDVTHTAKPDPQGRRLFLDTETGLREWEVLPDDDEPEPIVRTVRVSQNFGMNIEAEKQFEAESRPTKPVKRRKSQEGDK